MHTSIDPDKGIDTIENYLNLYGTEPKSYMPKKFIVDLLRLIMTKNIFQFGNT